MAEAHKLILEAWLALALVLGGLGALTQRLWGQRVEGAESWIRCFWLGWATLLLLLQLWHFALPIDDRALLLVVPLGLLGLLSAGTRPWRALVRGLRSHLPAIVVFALLVAWLGQRAMGGASNGDTGYYYLPTVAWLRSFPIVPGLANLSAPLAYNQTYFHYVSLIDTGPFVHRPYHIANGILLLALFARGLLGASRTFRRGGGAPADVFYLLFLPVAVEMVFHVNFTSPAPDFPVFVLGVVLSGELVALLTRTTAAPAALFTLAVLATTAVTVKLSLAALAATTLLVAAAASARRGAGPATFAGVAALGLVFGLPWLAGNAVLSGYPFYPSTFAGLPLPWRVPADVASLVREASSLHGSVSMAWKDPRWFLTSLDSLGWKTREVLLPLGMTAVALVAGPVRMLLGRGRPRHPGVPAAALVPVLVALAAWFYMAPRPRFAGAAFWLLGIEAVLVALGGWIASRLGRGALALLALALTVVAVQDKEEFLRRLSGFEPSSPPVVQEQTLASGLVVNVPKNQSCWYAPLPCTPEPHPGLRLREPGNLAAGFVIDPALGEPGP